MHVGYGLIRLIRYVAWIAWHGMVWWPRSTPSQFPFSTLTPPDERDEEGGGEVDFGGK